MSVPQDVRPPAWLQFGRWMFDPTGYLEAMAQRHGDLFGGRVSASFDKLVFVHHPQAIQYLLSNDTGLFRAPGDFNAIMRPLLGDNSLMLLDGAHHRHRRKLLMPPFHGELMRAYGALIRQIAAEVGQSWQAGQVFRARSQMQRISMRVILQAVFGLHRGDRYRALERLLGERLDAMSRVRNAPFLFIPALQKNLGPLTPWQSLEALQQQIDELLYAEIAERRAQERAERSDILSLLLAARDEQGQGMSDRELRDELMTLLVAGHETTATALAWALYWVHAHPEVGERLRQEIDELGADADPEAIAQLPYLTAVCQETLRIYPVAMLTFPRTPTEPVALQGYTIEPGTIVMGCIYLLHQRPELYPSPKHFNPERFLHWQPSPYEFMPFGGGVRRCVGSELALYEMKLVLFSLLSQYRLALAETRPVKPRRRGLILGPAGGVKLVMAGTRAPARQTAAATPSR